MEGRSQGEGMDERRDIRRREDKVKKYDNMKGKGHRQGEVKMKKVRQEQERKKFPRTGKNFDNFSTDLTEYNHPLAHSFTQSPRVPSQTLLRFVALAQKWLQS